MGKKNTVRKTTHDMAREAALEAYEIFKEKERQRIKRSRYHNTELLLKNYLNLVDHFENAKFSNVDIAESYGLDADEDEITIQSIKRSKTRTKIMILRIDTCLDILKRRQTNKKEPEKYEVIYCLYLDKVRRDLDRKQLMESLVHELNCSQASLYRWKKEMITELSILLYGVDGLSLDL